MRVQVDRDTAPRATPQPERGQLRVRAFRFEAGELSRSADGRLGRNNRDSELASGSTVTLRGPALSPGPGRGGPREIHGDIAPIRTNT